MDVREGTDIAVGWPSAILSIDNIGLGNMLNIYVYLQLLNPTTATHIKWVDIIVRHTMSKPTTRWPGRELATDPVISGSYAETDTVPERAPVKTGTNNLYKRWRNWRLPNPADPENYEPWTFNLPHADPEESRSVIQTPALGDGLIIYWFPIAVNSSEDAVFRTTERIQVGVMPGGYARTP
jgi:hypothetical protein